MRKKLHNQLAAVFTAMLVAIPLLFSASVALALDGYDTSKTPPLIYGVVNDSDQKGLTGNVDFVNDLGGDAGSNAGANSACYANAVGSGETDNAKLGIINCGKLVLKAFADIQAKPQEAVIKNFQTFGVVYSTGKRIQGHIEDTWFNKSGPDGLINSIIEFNVDLNKIKKDHSDAKNLFTIDGMGNVKFSPLGQAKWSKFVDARYTIDGDVSDLYRMLAITNSIRPPISCETAGCGPVWRTDMNLFGASPVDPAQRNVSDYSIYIPTNLGDVLLKNQGNDALIISQDNNGTYVPLQQFLQDYSKYQNFTADMLSGGVDPKTGKANGSSATVSADAAVASLAAIASGTQASVGTGVSDSGSGPIQRCGSAAKFLGVFTVFSFNYDFCVITDFGSQFADSLLLSAGQLITYTASIPNASDPRTIKLADGTYYKGGGSQVPQSFWGNLLPSDLTTPFQQLMIDQGSDVGKVVKSTSSVVSGLLGVLMVLIFLTVAVANILQIQLNNYGIRKIIPSLIIGFIMAQASFYMIRVALEVSGQLSNEIINLANHDSKSKSENKSIIQNFVTTFGTVRGKNGPVCFTSESETGPLLTGDCTRKSTINNGVVFQQFVLNGFVIVGAILLFILGFLFAVRVIVFTIAVPIAPLAVFSRFFPPLTSMIWGRWSKTVFNWILMPIPVVGLLLISSIYFGAANVQDPTAVNPVASGPVSTNSSPFGYILNYIAGIFFLFAAIKAPFSMAGEGKAVMDRWNSLGKFGYNQLGGQALKNQYGAVSSGFKARSDAMSKTAGMSGPLGRRALALGGVLKKDAESKDDMHKAIETRGHNDAKHLWESKGGTALKYILGNKNLLTQKEVGKEAFRMQTQQDIIKGKHDAEDADWAEKQKEKILSEDDGKYAKIMAETEKIKELTGQIADIFKSEIKMRKEKQSDQSTL